MRVSASTDPSSVPATLRGHCPTVTAARFFWRALAIVCVILAVIGMILPVMPTVPFLIVAAWAAGRGWPRLEVWLLEHPRYGPDIRRWREHGSIPRRAKWLATSMMVLSTVVLMVMSVAVWVKFAAPAMMTFVALWLWTRPET